MYSLHSIAVILCLALAMMPALAWPASAPQSLKADSPGEQGDLALREMCQKYYREREQIRQGDRQSFLVSWEREFKQAIAHSQAADPARWRVMEALMQVQVELGKKDDAWKTSQETGAYAKKAGDVEKQVTAGSQRLELLADAPMETVLREVSLIEGTVAEFAKQRTDAAASDKCSETLYRIGVLLTRRAITDKQDGNAATVLQTAIDALERSLIGVNMNSAAYAARMFCLAQAQSRLGLQAEAAASYEKVANVKQSEFSRLRIECLRISESTTKDSKEYQAALERALADSRARGEKDDLEVTMRHILGVSYRDTKQYAKSTEILSANAGNRGDPGLLAHDRLLIALNARDSKDVDGARKILEEVVAKYPKTGGGQMAYGELKKSMYQPRPTEASVAQQKPKRGVLIGANLAAITILVAIFVRRQVKRKSLQHSRS
jgi:tetratricopeptide (TPR) repeat protein